MNFFEKILKLLDSKMTTPTPYSWFHILFLFLTIIGCIFIVKKGKKLGEKQNRKLLFIFGLIMIIFEIYKQLNYSYNPSNDTWDYQWYAFPFQFCSTPMYIIFISSFFAPSKFRDKLYAFLSSYSILAGALVMLMPTTVFTSTIGINIQTMFHHGGMVVIGVYLAATNRTNLHKKSILDALPTFLILVSIAFILNISIYKSGILNGETFNMFYISPYFDTSLFIFDKIQPYIPYPIFLIIYIFAFTLGAYLILTLETYIKNKRIPQ